MHFLIGPLLTVLALSSLAAFAATFVLNFDSVILDHNGGQIDATAYLVGFGVPSVPITPGASAIKGGNPCV